MARVAAARRQSISFTALPKRASDYALTQAGSYPQDVRQDGALPPLVFSFKCGRRITHRCGSDPFIARTRKKGHKKGAECALFARSIVSTELT